MPSSFDLICCSLEDWDDVWRRNQYFVRELLELHPDGRVLFVEPPVDVLHDARRRIAPRRTGLRPIADHPRLFALKPIKVLPRVAGPGADRHLFAQVRRATNDLGLGAPILWINDATYAGLAARVTWPTVYDITDDWLLADTTPRELARRQMRETALLRRAEVVTVCSPTLAVSRGATRPVDLVTNGVDVDRYRTSQARPSDLPNATVALYVGTLHRDRLDVELAGAIAGAAPDIQFVYVGPVDLAPADVAALGSRPNVHLLGARPFATVPAYLQHADVLIVPHAVNGFTDSLDPLKLYEYLAAGRPVVATAVAGFRDAHLEQVRVVDPAGFAAAVRVAAGKHATFAAPPVPSWRDQATRFDEALRRAAASRSARRRVVYLDHSAELSGAELALTRLLPALHDVDSLVWLAEAGPLEARLADQGIAVEVVPLAARTQSMRRDRVRAGALPFSAMLDSLKYVAVLRRRLRSADPDLVHTNSLKAALYGSVAGRLAGVPVVCHLRDRIAADYLPRPAVLATRAVLRWLPSAVIANSQATMSTVGPTKTSIPHAVIYDIVEAPPAPPTRTPSRGFRVGIVGRLAPWKGQDVFLSAFAAAFAGSDAKARVVGSAMFGEDEYATRLHDLVDELGIRDQVDFVGFVDNVFAELAELDVLVHASTIPEPFGQVVIEAMAAGVAVIASAAGGPLEIIESGVTGVLVPPGDVRGLQTALLDLADDPVGRRALAAAALPTIGRFAPSVIAGEVEALYAVVTKPKQSRR